MAIYSRKALDPKFRISLVQLQKAPFVYICPLKCNAKPGNPRCRDRLSLVVFGLCDAILGFGGFELSVIPDTESVHNMASIKLKWTGFFSIN